MKKKIIFQLLLGFSSIRTSLTVGFSLLTSLLLIVTSFSSLYFSLEENKKTAVSYTFRLIQEINSSINSYIDNMESIGRVVSNSEELYRLLYHYQTPKEERETQVVAPLEKRLTQLMHTVANTRNDITNIAVISLQGDILLSDEEKEYNPYAEYQKTDWFQNALNAKGDMVLSSSHVQNLILSEYRWVISLSQLIQSPETGEALGVMVVDLNYGSIESICEKGQLGKDGYIYLVDHQENVVFHPQQPLLYSGIKSERLKMWMQIPDTENAPLSEWQGKLYVRSHSDLTNWDAIGVVNTGELGNRTGSVVFFLSIGTFSIGMAILFAALISYAITKPLQQLEHTMHLVEQGDLSVQADVPLDNEIGHLSRTFNSMVRQTKELIEQKIEVEKEKRRSEIKALQAQINPHFLYNTLETIIWMAASGKNQEVMEITAALAKLFRTSISNDDQLVTLGTEIENIQSYLTIQKKRYQDKLSYSISVNKELYSLLLPKLILQPIVENAIYHGVKPSPAGGKLEIRAERREQKLSLTVTDNGVGMKPEQLRSLLEKKKSSLYGKSGVGVRNVHQRIQLYFGDEYGLSFQSEDGRGTRVIISLPCVFSQEEIEGGEEHE